VDLFQRVENLPHEPRRSGRRQGAAARQRCEGSAAHSAIHLDVGVNIGVHIGACYRSPVHRVWPLLLLTSVATARDWTTGWSGFTQVVQRVERSRPDDSLRVNDDLSLDSKGFLTPRVHDTVTTAFVAVGGWAEYAEWLRLRGGLDSGGVAMRGSGVTIDGVPIDALEPEPLREAWAELHHGGATLGAGKRRLRVGGGLVFDEYATGAAASFTWQDLRADVGVWRLGRALLPTRGPLIHGRVSWSVDVTNEVYVFGAVLTDDAEAAEELVQAFIEQRVLQSRVGETPILGGLTLLALDACTGLAGEARPWHVGGGADLLFAGHSVHAAAVIGRGSGYVDLERAFQSDACRSLVQDLPPVLRTTVEGTRGRLPFGRLATELESFAVDLTWRTRVAEWLYPGAAFTWLSGSGEGGRLGTEDEPGTLEVYLAPAPYLPRSALFFDAGLGSGFETRTAVTAGVLGRGVVAPALTALVVPHDRVEIDLRAVWLEADAPGPFGEDRTYGQEYDLELRWELVDGLSVEAALDVMIVGGFYPEDGVWWRVTSGVSSSFPL